MTPDYKPEVPEWFRQQFHLGSFLAQTQAWLDGEQKETISRRYFVGTVFCWLAAALLLLASAVNLHSTFKEDSVTSLRSKPFSTTSTDTPTPSRPLYVESESKVSPLLTEPDAMARVVDQLGAIEVQASLYTAQGETYTGPLWIRKVMRGDSVYLDDAVLYSIEGPFRFRLPANSTVYIYAPVPGLNWNSGWGVPIKTPESVSCNQPCGCALRLEDLMIAARQK